MGMGTGGAGSDGPLPTGAPVDEEGPWPRARRRRRLLLAVAVAWVAVAIGFLAFLWWYDLSVPGTRVLFGLGFFGFFLILIIGFWCIRIAMWSTRGYGRYGGSYGRGSGSGYGGPRRGGWDPAIMEARRRYARGEITREQFLQIVRDIRQSRGGPGSP